MTRRITIFGIKVKNIQRFINKNSIKKLQLFSVSTLIDIVRIPPSLFGSTLKKAAETILKSKYESMINQELVYIIMVIDSKVEPMGKMIPGDGGTFHRVEFQAMIIANQRGRTLKVGSMIRTRITAVSLGKASTMGKIGITCRQPFLGTEEWIKEEIKKANGEEVDVKEIAVEEK